ncbi:MAG: hisD [Gammaproteobacteria bacterium]|nr:hisD [Gammaproteobacteria bacterium]
MTILKIFQPADPGYARDIEALRTRLHGGGLVAADAGNLDVPKIVADILKQVREGGDAAAARLTSQFDQADLTTERLRVSQDEIDRALKQADQQFLTLIRKAIRNIRDYQEHILIKAPPALQRGGRQLGVRYLPLDRVAVYVPGGQALYPSTVLMTVVPAQVAGVKEVILLSPPKGGDINPLVLALAGELRIKEVYRLGGAVAVAAAAFGTATIRPVDKIVGPGNAFVAEAKRQLFGRVGIDSIAGPSEVLIIADDTANPDWVAADLLAQAEHNPGSALLITPSSQLAETVAAVVDRQLAQLQRADITRPSMEQYSAVIVVRDLAAACELANRFATEHLQIMTADDESCLKKIRHAGAIFIGAHTPVPLGDYYAGPSHVLPTGGTARFFGPLSCNDFLKASSIIRYDAKSLAEDAGSVSEFAEREGLTAHARAVTIRKESM